MTGPAGTPSPVASVVVALPVPRVFSYAIPPELTARLAPGHRVRVPFHGRPRVGVVVGIDGGVPATAVEAIETLLDPVPALTPPLLELARWAAAETASAWGDNHTSFFGNHERRDDHIGLTIVFKRNRDPRTMVPFGQING